MNQLANADGDLGRDQDGRPRRARKEINYDERAGRKRKAQQDQSLEPGFKRPQTKPREKKKNPVADEPSNAGPKDGEAAPKNGLPDILEQEEPPQVGKGNGREALKDGNEDGRAASRDRPARRPDGPSGSAPEKRVSQPRGKGRTIRRPARKSPESVHGGAPKPASNHDEEPTTPPGDAAPNQGGSDAVQIEGDRFYSLLRKIANGEPQPAAEIPESAEQANGLARPASNKEPVAGNEGVQAQGTAERPSHPARGGALQETNTGANEPPAPAGIVPATDAESQPGIGEVDRVPNADQFRAEVVRKIQDNKPAREYFEKFRDHTGVYEAVYGLMQYHEESEDWRFAQQPQVYLDNGKLLEASWTLPQALVDMTNVQDAAQLGQIWSAELTCQACKAWLQETFDNEWLRSNYGVPDLVKWILNLISHHSEMSNAAWWSAPSLTRYICNEGDFRMDEPWPLNLRRLKDSWQAQREQLLSRTGLQPEELELRLRFEGFYKYAKDLFTQTGAFITLGYEWPSKSDPRIATATFRRWMLDAWHKNINEQARDLLIPLWDSNIAQTPDDAPVDFVEQMREAREAINSDTDTLPPSYEAVAYHLEWTALAQTLNATTVDTRIIRRFNQLKIWADQTKRAHGVLLRVRHVDESVSLAQHIENTAVALRGQWLDDFHATWTDAYESEQSPQEKNKLRAFTRQVVLALMEGGNVQRPFEEGIDKTFVGTDPTNEFGRTQWKMQSPLGQGGFGEAMLWVRTDNGARIVERKVIKTVYLSQRETAHSVPEYDKSQYWSNDITVREPLENHLARELERCNDSDHIVGCQGTGHSYEQQMMYRTYMHFYPHRTLATLMRDQREVCRNPLIDEHGRPIDHRFPVRALWAIFEALTSAVCLMKLGHLPGGQPPVPPPPQLIHCDIKPDNIFLDGPDAKGLWPEIPKLAIGDFGLARTTHPLGIPVPCPGGTKGYRAPEQARWQPVTFATDVWAIGRIMFNLANLTQPLAQTEDLESDEDDRNFPPLHTQATQAFYPQEMLRLIDRCLQRDPTQRIQVEELWRAISAQVRTTTGLHDQPMRTRPRPDDEVSLLVRPDEHKQWHLGTWH